jgi:hypothetical protein
VSTIDRTPHGAPPNGNKDENNIHILNKENNAQISYKGKGRLTLACWVELAL